MVKRPIRTEGGERTPRGLIVRTLDRLPGGLRTVTMGGEGESQAVNRNPRPKEGGYTKSTTNFMRGWGTVLKKIENMK